MLPCSQPVGDVDRVYRKCHEQFAKRKQLTLGLGLAWLGSAAPLKVATLLEEAISRPFFTLSYCIFTPGHGTH